MSEKTAFAPYPDHEGLQPMAVYRSQWPDHSGMTHVPHSDKRAVPIVQEYQPQRQSHENIVATISVSDFPQYRRADLPSRSPPKRYCGLTKRALIIAVVLVACLVFGAGIGGGIGGAVARRKSESALNADSHTAVVTYTSAGHIVTSTITSTSPTVTSTQSSIPPDGLGEYNCPAQNDTTYTSSINAKQTYAIFCDVDQPAGVAGIDAGVVSDMNSGVVAWSIEACIDACAGSATWGVACAAVTYEVNVTAALERYGSTGNCVFKSQKARVSYPYYEEDGIITAFLLTEWDSR